MGHRTGDQISSSCRQAALSAAFEAHYDTIYRFLMARSGDRSIAEDTAAETFAEAARYVATKHADVSLPWLLAVARRRLIDRYRRNERHRRRVQKLAQMTDLSTSEEMPMPSESDHAIVTALRSLPERQRIALTLRYLDDYSVQEVADALGCAYRASESLLARARRSFVAAYQEIGLP